MSHVASSRRAAAVGPCVRRRTRHRSRTALDEDTGSSRNSKWREEEARSNMSECEASSDTSGSVSSWESDYEEGIVGMMESIFSALERLERRDKGKRRENGNEISV
jgi:hypothetical protein